jgi:hypothetical protein
MVSLFLIGMFLALTALVLHFVSPKVPPADATPPPH